MRLSVVLHEAKDIRFGAIGIGIIVAAYCFGCGAAAAQSSDGGAITRGVRIIDSPTPPASPPASTAPSGDTPSAASPAPTSPAPADGPRLLSPPPPSAAVDTGGSAPMTPAPSSTDDTTSTPLLTPAAPASAALPSPVPSNNAAPTTPVPPPNVADLPSPPNFGIPLVPQNFAALSAAMQIPNTAGLSVQMLPGQEIATGSRISFQVSTKKPGYLILLDVNAAGKLAQLYPNPMSLLEPAGISAKSNLLRPGQVLQLPDHENPYTGFELVAAPPSGTAMVIAMLSEHPVQLVDLPDVPGSLLGSASTVDYLVNLSNQLRIPNAGGDGRLEDAHWSFDVKFYAVR
jgi:hypothetical protein